MAYVADLTTLAGVRRGDLEYRGLKITRKLNGGMNASCSIDNRRAAAPEATIGNRVLRVYDDELDLIRFHGKLRDPHVRKPDMIELHAGSPYTLLDRRRLQVVFSRTARDAGLILSDVIDAENARGATRLRMAAAIPASTNRDRTYEPGKSVQEIALQLAEVDDGFYFVEQPLDGVAGVYSELEIRYPGSGVDRPKARFEYGDDTYANVDDYTITETLPQNAVTATGAGDGDAKLVSRKTDAGSIATYDLLEAEIAFSDVSIQATLDQHAQEHLRPLPGATITIAPIDGGAAVAGGTYVPRLWRDIDVGDVGRVTIHDGATVWDNVHVRLTEATIEISDTSAAAESLTGLVLEVV